MIMIFINEKIQITQENNSNQEFVISLFSITHCSTVLRSLFVDFFSC